ncbi:hypothetical protein HYX10_06435 [Candidatus Woesearchaeota archaeon]|nr:hypothetical protein [Candidatus Woesearchaeota archaeon]
METQTLKTLGRELEGMEIEEALRLIRQQGADIVHMGEADALTSLVEAVNGTADVAVSGSLRTYEMPPDYKGWVIARVPHDMKPLEADIRLTGLPTNRVVLYVPSAPIFVRRQRDDAYELLERASQIVHGIILDFGWQNGSLSERVLHVAPRILDSHTLFGVRRQRAETVELMPVA